MLSMTYTIGGPYVVGKQILKTVPHREECWKRRRLAMVAATMITMPQNKLGRTHSSAAGISVCQCGKCAEATLDVKMDLMLRPVMRISNVFHTGERLT